MYTPCLFKKGKLRKPGVLHIVESEFEAIKDIVWWNEAMIESGQKENSWALSLRMKDSFFLGDRSKESIV